MIESYLTEELLTKGETAISDYLRTSQTNFVDLRQEAFSDMLLDFDAMGLTIHQLCERLILQDTFTTGKSAAFSGAITDEDFAQRMRLVIPVSTVTSAVFTLQGTDDNGTNYNDIELISDDNTAATTVTIAAVAIGDDANSYLITRLYKQYRLKLISATSVIYTAYMIEDVYTALHRDKARANVYRTLQSTEDDIWDRKREQYENLYKERLASGRFRVDYTDDSKISKVEGLENLINLNFIDLENNKINSILLNTLKVDNKAFCFISYCILKPIIEELEDIIIWSNLIEIYPFLKILNFKNLNKIVKFLRNFEVLREKGNILSIVTPKYLSKELDKILLPRSEMEELEYEIISQELKIKNIETTKRFVNYVLKNDLSSFSLYKTKNGIKRASIEHLQHQLAIYDTPNQKSFFSKNSFEYRINQLEGFFSSRQKPEMQVIKFAFINNEVYHGGNTAGINFLDKNARWNLICISKEKKELIILYCISCGKLLNNSNGDSC
ncbi:hypothetical protein LCGC14_2332410, partial [marine sediment metagenome]